MLFRKIRTEIENHLKSNPDKILLVDGARQVGKTFIIREVAKDLFPNFIEINMIEDYAGEKLFLNVKTIEEFYLQLSTIAGNKLGTKKDTIIFLDEIQQYPDLLTLLKFLREDNKFTYIASGSLLGVTLANTTSIPMGSIRKIRMYPLDFEEFLIANNVNDYAINIMKNKFENLVSLDESLHNKILDLFKRYLLVGGLPDVVNTYLNTHNIQFIRRLQNEIQEYYAADAAKYDKEHKLKIARIYNLIPSNLENKKKRVNVKDIENKKGARFSRYADEFDYLINSGIALEVKAISNQVYPLKESETKNLLKLYLNDVGLLTNALYGTNIRAILDENKSINLGSLYENVVASELIAHGFKLYYYDNRNKGEVDYLIDDYENLSSLPIEVKSGKDYTVHSALNNFLSTEEYHIKHAYVFSNERKVYQKGNITYLPIYYIMFIQNVPNEEDLIF